MHEFESIETSVITKLEAIEGLKTISSYSGQLNVDEIERITFQFPCIYVVANTLKQTDFNRVSKYEIDFSLIVGDRNVRGSKASARGDTSSPGVYGLLENIRELIHNKKMMAGWSPAKLIDEHPIIYLPEYHICVYSATYKMSNIK